MALFITLELISRPSAKMLSLAQHADYAQHLSVYAVSCTVVCKKIVARECQEGKGDGSLFKKIFPSC
jgi:hypothetical protein